MNHKNEAGTREAEVEIRKKIGAWGGGAINRIWGPNA